MIKYYTVYQTTNLINNKIYIGRHITTNINDGYLGSGKLLCIDIKTYGKEFFKKEILYIFDNHQEMFDKEKELVNNDFRNREDTYNIALGGDSWGMMGVKLDPRTDEYRKKMSQVKKGKSNGPMSEEQRELRKGRVTVKDKDGNKLQVRVDDERYLNGELIFILKGYTHSDELKQKWSIERRGAGNHMFGKKKSAESIEKSRQGNIGRKVSEETKEKMSIAKKGKKISQPRSEEWRQKQSKAQTGKKHSEFTDEHKNKIRLSKIGKCRSEETKQKIRASNLKKSQHKRIAILLNIINGLISSRK